MLLQSLPPMVRVPCAVEMEEDRRSPHFVRIAAVVPILWLGEVVIASISRKVRYICSALQVALRQWSVNFMCRRLLSIMVVMNPRLSADQQQLLLGIMARAIEHLLWHHSFDPRVMRGIVALACPNHNTASFLSYLVELIANITEDIPHNYGGTFCDDPMARDGCSNMDMGVDLEAGECGPLTACEEDGHEVVELVIEGEDVEKQERRKPFCSSRLLSSTEQDGTVRMEDESGTSAGQSSTQGRHDQLCMIRAQEDTAVTRTLISHFCMDTIYVAAMPPMVRKSVLESLWSGEDIRQLLCRYATRNLGLPRGPQRPTSPPICSITLEPLLLPDCTMPEDVVAVIQRQHGQKIHAFLYRGRALYNWLQATPTPTNPRTRAWVLPTDVYRLS